MANQTLKVDTSGLQSISTQLKTQASEIKSFYTNSIQPILAQSEEALKVSGLDYSSVESAYQTLFTNLGTQLEGLATNIDNTVIPNYQSLSQNIAKAFNSDFASQMNEIISKIK